jgi:hypothetical protein
MFEALKNINFSKIFNTTHKAINVINKAIPVYKQVKPNIGNFKNLFSKTNHTNQIIDEIKASRPIMLKKNIPNKINRNTSNNTLTFFQ